MNLFNIITFYNSFMIKNNIKFKSYDLYDMYNTYTNNVINNSINNLLNTNSYNITDNLFNYKFTLADNRDIYLQNNVLF
jgi:hypothetical protein